MTIFNHVSSLDKLFFAKHLAVMIKSGIPLAEAVEMLRSQTTNPAFRKILESVTADIRNGQSLTGSLSKFPSVFDSLFRNLVEVGDQSGSLEKSFVYLASQLQKSYEFKKKVQSAMLYPTFVIVVAVVMGGGIALFVLPQMVNLFSSLTTELPLSTRILIAVANFMKNYGAVVVPSFFAGFVVLSLILHSKPIKPHWHRFLLSIPVFGLFLRQAETATICRNLGLMLQAGLPINKALAVAAEATSNLVYRRYLEQIAQQVEKGKAIGSELETGKYPFLPAIVAKMVAVGEKTGKLDENLTYLADFFEEEVDTMAKDLPTILEPILLVAIAAIVAFIALAIISPIYQFTGSVHK